MKSEITVLFKVQEKYQDDQGNSHDQWRVEIDGERLNYTEQEILHHIRELHTL